MICYVLAVGKQHLGPHVIVGYGIKIFSPGLFISSPDHLAVVSRKSCLPANRVSRNLAREKILSCSSKAWELAFVSKWRTDLHV